MTYAESLRAKAQAKREKANALVKRANTFADQYPGSFVTGASGRSRAQNRGTERGLNAVINASVKAIALRQAADRLEHKAWRIENAVELARQRDLEKAASKATDRAERKKIRSLPLDQRLFSCIMPTCFVYCDRAKEKNGDYLEVARLYFSTLTETIFEPNSPLLPLIKDDIERIKAMKGQAYQVSGAGQTITLGYALK